MGGEEGGDGQDEGVGMHWRLIELPQVPDGHT